MFVRFFMGVVLLRFCFFDALAVNDKDKGPYASVFDASIYDQSKLQQKFGRSFNKFEEIDNSNIQKEILLELLERKITRLETGLFKSLDLELQDLKILMDKYKPPVIKKIGKTVGTTAVGLASNAMFLPLAPELGATRLFVALGIGGTSAIAGGAMTGLQEFLEPDGELSIDKMRGALERKKKELVLNLNHESISSLETFYVLRKRFLSSPLQEQIEKALMMTRDGLDSPELTMEFLENALSMPILKKTIPLNQSWWDFSQSNLDAALEATPEQNHARKTLMRYDRTTKSQLVKMLMQIIHSSSSNVYSFRRFYYFYGSPGLGKSTAARSIPQLLGLPYFETNIRTSEDISQKALEGGDWQREYLGVPGHLANAMIHGGKFEENAAPPVMFDLNSRLLEPYEAEKIQAKFYPLRRKSYLNSFLIINDFDRLLLDPGTSTQTLSFLLDYLDPEKEFFQSPYFRSPVRIKDLTIIITGNNRIPEDEKFEALRDRLVEIEFDQFEADAKQEISQNFLSNMLRKYNLKESDVKLGEPVAEETSIRKAKKRIEGQVIQKAAEVYAEQGIQNPSIQEGDAQVFDEEEISQDGGSVESLPRKEVYHIFFPIFSSDTNVAKEVKTLQHICKSAKGLSSEKQFEQLAAIRAILGRKKAGGLGNLAGIGKGKINDLWSTSWLNKPKNWSFRIGEKPGNLLALLKRIERSQTPDGEDAVIKYHLQLVQAIAKGLIDIRNREAEQNNLFLTKKISHDKRRMNLIKKLQRHMEAIKNLYQGPRTNDLNRYLVLVNSKIRKHHFKYFVDWFNDEEVDLVQAFSQISNDGSNESAEESQQSSGDLIEMEE